MKADDRARRIAIEGSPTFYYSNSSIGASGIWTEEFEGATAQAKYLPFDSCSITNASSYDIQVTLGAHTFIVPGNTVKTIEDVAFRRFVIENLNASNSISADDLRVGVWLSPLSEKKAIQRKAYHQFKPVYRRIT